MISETTEIKCTICGKVFYTKYYEEGSITHENYTSNHNMRVFVNRFNTFISNKDNLFYNSKYDLFLEAITLEDNLCNMKYRRFDVIMEIFECRIKWLTNNNHMEIVKYLESNRKNIKKEFNKLQDRFIEEKKEEIKKIQERRK